MLASSITLFKWQVYCETMAPDPAPSSSQCLAATLTAAISRSGSAKSVVLPHTLSLKDKGNEGRPLGALYLWVLNPNVIYASSQFEGKRTGMKVLYQAIGVEQGNKLVESMTSDVQDISLPLSVIEATQETLESSSLLLPEQERRFRDWKVGLLERWDMHTNTG